MELQKSFFNFFDCSYITWTRLFLFWLNTWICHVDPMLLHEMCYAKPKGNLNWSIYSLDRSDCNITLLWLTCRWSVIRTEWIWRLQLIIMSPHYYPRPTNAPIYILCYYQQASSVLLAFSTKMKTIAIHTFNFLSPNLFTPDTTLSLEDKWRANPFTAFPSYFQELWYVEGKILLARIYGGVESIVPLVGYCNWLFE